MNVQPYRWQWNRSDRGALHPSIHTEMMLDSDMCLFYGDSLGRGIDVDNYDPTTKCCAYVPSSITGMDKIIENNDGSYCGQPVAEWSTISGHQERQTCCRSQHTDCGRSEHRGGWASRDVWDFAQNEERWLWEMMQAWKKVTEL